ncbi:MAG: Maf family protein [Lachnospiraceae bacterium]|nr:Maf family protein [Lachnospiraceae bacterium]
MSRIILASGSPRRKELLEQIGLEFEICPAKGEEVITTNVPEDVVRELSRQKAEEVASGILAYNEAHPDIVTPQDILVIGADTVVAYGGQILGKPADEADAKRMLSMLSGNVHSVYTGVTFVIIGKDGRTGESSFVEKTDVHMFAMSEQEIDRYIASGEPMDKAGSYAIQGKCGIYIEKIDGDYYNVVGLPIARMYQSLKDIGIDLFRW